VSALRVTRSPSTLAVGVTTVLPSGGGCVDGGAEAWGGDGGGRCVGLGGCGVVAHPAMKSPATMMTCGRMAQSSEHQTRNYNRNPPLGMHYV
jgi:hypothetical protein